MLYALAMDEAVVTSFTSGITGIVADVMQFVAITVPIVLGLVGAIFAIKKGIKFFQNIGNKA